MTWTRIRKGHHYGYDSKGRRWEAVRADHNDGWWIRMSGGSCDFAPHRTLAMAAQYIDRLCRDEVTER